MKKTIFFLIILGLLFIGFQNRTILADKANQIFYQSPCDTPKTFRIGTIDPRFGITKQELITDAKKAASAWKNNKGMVLLKYDPNANMPINMIYDQRQALNSQINTLNNQVTQQKNTLKPEISSYEQQVAQFKQKSNALNQEIQYWNSKGGAPQNIYNNLVAQQQSLQQEATRLQNEANQLNQSTVTYNQQINQLDNKISAFNSVLSLTPEEGEYIRNGTSEQIDIFITNSQRELIHTLAHEMGHSLGLGHNSNPNSIMYPYTNTAITPSVNDEEALAQVCRKQNIFEIAVENIVLTLGTLHQKLDTFLIQHQ